MRSTRERVQAEKRDGPRTEFWGMPYLGEEKELAWRN